MFLLEKKLRQVMKLLTRRRFFPKEKEYLNEQFVGRLATARDNKPHVVPVRYAFKSGKIYIDTARDSKKTRNIIKNNRVAFVVDDYATLDGVKRARGVLIEGQAEILESGKNYELGRKLIREKYSSVKGYQKGFCKDRVIIVINPNEISGWGL